MVYDRRMTREQIATLLERVAELPDDAHAELVETIVRIEARYAGVYRLNTDERGALARSAEDVGQGRFASDADVAALFARHGAL
jgi:hypothetical protein